MKKARLCVLCTHPIQYITPWFRCLAQDPELELHVIFLRQPDPLQQGAGFGTALTWDLPLREGYASEVLGMEFGVRHTPRTLLALARRLRAWRPDLVLVMGWHEPALIASYPLLRLLRIPALTRGDSHMLQPRAAWKKPLHRGLLSLMSGALQVGRSNREFYLANGLPAQRVYEGAHFVDSERMLRMAAEHAAQRERLRAEAGFGPDDFVFCFLGKHMPVKRPQLLLEAAAQLRSAGHPVALLVGGSGELSEELRQRCTELGLPAHFTGFLNQSELWRAYVPADAFVLPSRSESWGLVINEAQLFGLPVIVGEGVACGPDLVRDGETGFIFRGGAAALAQAMLALMQDPAAARRMGDNGRRLVTGHYSMPVATRGLKQAIAALVPG